MVNKPVDLQGYCSGFRVKGSRFGVWGFRIWSLGFRVQFKVRIQDLEFRASATGS